MLKQLNRAELDQLLATIATDYRLHAPQLLTDGSRQLAPYDCGKLSLSGNPLQRKPTSYFFPQTEKLLSISADGAVVIPPQLERPLALFGLDGTDLAGIAFLDRFFMTEPADDAYLRNRSGTLLIALTGVAGGENQFLPLATGDCDLELIAIPGSWLALGHSSRGEELLAGFSDGDNERLTALRKVSDSMRNDFSMIQQASTLIQDDQVPDQFWTEIADRCILCSGCNMTCPTCSCFCVQDRSNATGTERSRVWDSCQLDAFMREASGHNPLGTEALRTRRRIHHKLAADVQRWGQIGCVGCGRCDRTCPTGIGIFAVCEEIVRRFGEAGGKS